MTVAELQALLAQVRDGRVDTAKAFETLAAALREQPFEDLGFAKVEIGRAHV